MDKDISFFLGDEKERSLMEAFSYHAQHLQTGYSGLINGVEPVTEEGRYMLKHDLLKLYNCALALIRDEGIEGDDAFSVYNTLVSTHSLRQRGGLTLNNISQHHEEIYAYLRDVCTNE